MSNNKQQLELAANTIRVISAEAVQKANSGHPGMPMGMAELGACLWLKYLRYDCSDPGWLGRDRFVLSNGHGSMFLYTMLHLAGYDLSLEDLKQFRQWDSKTPGHPESFMTPGVETTTGPLGQGVANAVGMAIGARMMSERYRSADFDPFSANVFCFCGDGCLMEGVSGEASSLAGHLGLGNLKMIYDDNEISIAGHTDLAFTEDVAKRYESYGWQIIDIDGHDFEQIDKAYGEACSVTDKPSLIIAHTTIGKGSPNKANTSGVHGSPLGADELELTKKELGWSGEEFFVPQEVKDLFAARAEALSAEVATWREGFDSWKNANAEKAANLESQLSSTVPADLEQKLIAALPADGKAIATRKLSASLIQVAANELNSLVGGSADLEPSTLTLIKDSTDVTKESFSGVNLRFGVREHAMGAVMNGLAYYGGFIPFGSTFLCFLDYMKPAVRLAALSHLPGLFIFTHDSVFLGEDGPTHQPIEHLAMMRSLPNLWTFRPADELEAAVAYAQALARKDGPSALVFTRQNVDPIERPDNFDIKNIHRGAYTVFESAADPELVFIATGSEVSLAIDAAKQLSSATRVVSMPCWEIFREQDAQYREKLIPEATKKVVIEAASPFGWLTMVGGRAEDTLVIGIERFGGSAPYKVIAEKFGFTSQQIVAKVENSFDIG